RLVVEGVALAGGAAHEELHDALRRGAVVQPAVLLVGQQHRRQGDAAEAAAGSPEKLTTVKEAGDSAVHGASQSGRIGTRMIRMQRMNTDQTKDIRLKTESRPGPGLLVSVRSVFIRFIRIIRVPIPSQSTKTNSFRLNRSRHAAARPCLRAWAAT